MEFAEKDEQGNGIVMHSEEISDEVVEEKAGTVVLEVIAVGEEAEGGEECRRQSKRHNVGKVIRKDDDGKSFYRAFDVGSGVEVSQWPQKCPQSNH